MPDADFYIARGDTLPILEATLLNADGTPINLTGADVTFRMKFVATSVSKINSAATIVDAAAGKVSYVWTGSNTDTAGLFIADFLIAFSNGIDFEKVPNSDFIRVHIRSDSE
jgi:hypothetical protein